MGTERASTLRVVHYLNQFFGGIGGEEAAGHGVLVRPGPAGPGLAIQKALSGRGEVVATVVCGDNFFAEHQEEALPQVVAAVAEARPDLVLCGPAFNAGRYGMACGAVGRAVAAQLGVPVVSGMYPENPAVDEFRRDVYIIPTGNSAAGMGQVVPKMVALGLKLVAGEALGPAASEGYLARGERRNGLAEQIGARRALEMLLKKVRGEPYRTEMPLPSFDRVPAAAPLKDLASATIALMTEGGIVPKGNPDRIETHSATRWARYSIAGLSRLSSEGYECVHGGFDTSYVLADPNRLVPLDAARALEAQGVIGKLHDELYSTVGNSGPISRARTFGREMAEGLKAAGVQGVVLTAT